jgi:hypothetical protein
VPVVLPGRSGVIRAYNGATFAGAPSAAQDGQPAGMDTIGYRRRQRRHSSALGVAIVRAYPLTRPSPPVSTRRVIYCVIPRELESELLERMTEHYRENPNVEVIIDRRHGGPNERRRGPAGTVDERRLVRDRRRPRAPGTFPRTDAFET